MGWKCPDDWKYIPEAENASEGMLMTLIFGDAKRFQQFRIPWFRRCNASGKWIWPMQKAWRGVVGIKHGHLDLGGSNQGGSYKLVWLNNDQYIIQKLKGNI